MIRQRQKSDCAVAAIAMATGNSYRAVKKVCGSTRGGLEIAEIEVVLWEFGKWRRYRPRKLVTIREFVKRFPRAVVIISRCFFEGHCIAVVDGVVYDPAAEVIWPDKEVEFAFLPV